MRAHRASNNAQPCSQLDCLHAARYGSQLPFSFGTWMHIHLTIGNSSDGKRAFEPTHATHIGEARYRIEFTPGLVYGIAAGDEIELGVDGAFTVVHRAGNIAVRVLSPEPFQGSEAELTAQVEEIGGRLDGKMARGLAYTIPYAAGFNAIEKMFNSYIHNYQKAVWEYGNVYTDEGTPMNWWLNVA